MATQTMSAHLCMVLEYPLNSNGHRDYCKPKVWVPELWGFKPSDDESRIYVGSQEVTIEVPDDFNPIPQQVAALEKKKREALDAYQATVAEINERLSKLLAITHEA